MYVKYNCNKSQHRQVIQSVGTPTISTITKISGGPESMRMLADVCPHAYITVPTARGDCTVVQTSSMTIAATEKLLVPVYPGNTPPIVSVQTMPASITTQQRALSVAAVESDPYNPATRFAAYFPAPPIPYICPERLPNNDPKPSTRPCIGITRFASSAELSTITSVRISYETAVSSAKGTGAPLPPVPDLLKTNSRC